MPSPFVKLFRRAFLSTDRPRPREWIEQLDALAKALKKCDLHSGHYYYHELRDCPWCGIESQARVRLFNFLLPGDDSRRGHFRLDEIWKEIASVEAPGASLIQWDKTLESPAPSAVVSAFARVRDNRISIALIFSVFAGLAIGLLVDFPLGLLMLILAGLIACAITRVGVPLFEKVQARHRRAKEEAQRLQEQYDLEPGNDQWDAKRDELRNRKETYENLAQIRQLKIQQLEAEARKNRLDEFLDQFEINDAEIKGINRTVKTALLSNGVETAADVSEIKKLKQIPSIGNLRARWLLDWRRDLEKKFVFDPAKGVPLEARLRTERDVDALRFQLESELGVGARHLRQMKREIETVRQRLQPALAQARLELSQAEVDLAVVSKRSPVALILAALILALIIAFAAKPSTDTPPPTEPVSAPGREPPPPPPRPRSMEKASSLLVKGELDSKEEKFDEAILAFQEAVSIDPNCYDAYVKLGYALYRLQRYQESAEASEKAINLRKGFEPYYNSGLAYMELGRWDKAKNAFYGVDEVLFYGAHPISIDSWEERYTLAFYYMARSQAKLGEAGDVIRILDDVRVLYNPKSLWALRTLRLGCLYLWVGKREAAIAQYKILKKKNSKLAAELLKLIKKHGNPA
jgi:tetratricopeptide (TPR) repeat protein